MIFSDNDVKTEVFDLRENEMQEIYKQLSEILTKDELHSYSFIASAKTDEKDFMQYLIVFIFAKHELGKKDIEEAINANEQFSDSIIGDLEYHHDREQDAEMDEAKAEGDEEEIADLEEEKTSAVESDYADMLRYMADQATIHVPSEFLELIYGDRNVSSNPKDKEIKRIDQTFNIFPQEFTDELKLLKTNYPDLKKFRDSYTIRATYILDPVENRDDKDILDFSDVDIKKLSHDEEDWLTLTIETKSFIYLFEYWLISCLESIRKSKRKEEEEEEEEEDYWEPSSEDFKEALIDYEEDMKELGKILGYDLDEFIYKPCSNGEIDDDDDPEGIEWISMARFKKPALNLENSPGMKANFTAYNDKKAKRQALIEHAVEIGCNINHDILKDILNTKQRKGNYYCPCMIVENISEEKRKDYICPCKPHLQAIKKNKRCHCGLFYK